MPAVPIDSIAATRPSISPAPIGATTPDSQADSTIRCGARSSRSRSCTVNGPSSSSSEENIGLSSRNRPCAAMWATAAPSRAAGSSRPWRSVAKQHRFRVPAGEDVELGPARRQPGPSDQHPRARRRSGRPRPEPECCGGHHADRHVGQRRHQGPRGGVQPAGRGEDNRPVAERPDGVAEQGWLEAPSDVLQVRGPTPCRLSQGEPGDGDGVLGLLGVAHRRSGAPVPPRRRARAAPRRARRARRTWSRRARVDQAFGLETRDRRSTDPARWWRARRIASSRRARSSSSCAAVRRTLRARLRRAGDGCRAGPRGRRPARRRLAGARVAARGRSRASARSTRAAMRGPLRAAWRMASAASSSPWRVASARSSELPRVARCSSSASSPRRQAPSTPRVATARRAPEPARASRSRGPGPRDGGGTGGAARAAGRPCQARRGQRTRPASNHAAAACSEPAALEAESRRGRLPPPVGGRRPLRGAGRAARRAPRRAAPVARRCRRNSSPGPRGADHGIPRGSRRRARRSAWVSNSSASWAAGSEPLGQPIATSATASSASPAANSASHWSMTRAGDPRRGRDSGSAASSYRRQRQRQVALAVGDEAAVVQRHHRLDQADPPSRRSARRTRPPALLASSARPSARRAEPDQVERAGLPDWLAGATEPGRAPPAGRPAPPGVGEDEVPDVPRRTRTLAATVWVGRSGHRGAAGRDRRAVRPAIASVHTEGRADVGLAVLVVRPCASRTAGRSSRSPGSSGRGPAARCPAPGARPTTPRGRSSASSSRRPTPRRAIRVGDGEPEQLGEPRVFGVGRHRGTFPRHRVAATVIGGGTTATFCGRGRADATKSERASGARGST